MMDRHGVLYMDEAAQQPSSGLLVKFRVPPPSRAGVQSLAPQTPLTIGLRALLFTRTWYLPGTFTVSLQMLADRLEGWTDVTTSQTVSISLLLFLPSADTFFFMSQTWIT